VGRRFCALVTTIVGGRREADIVQMAGDPGPALRDALLVTNSFSARGLFQRFGRAVGQLMTAETPSRPSREAGNHVPAQSVPHVSRAR